MNLTALVKLQAELLHKDQALGKEAVAKFGEPVAQVIAALADLANQMKTLNMLVDGDMSSIAAEHARCLAVIIENFCRIGNVDRSQFEEWMFKIAAGRMVAIQTIPASQVN